MTATTHAARSSNFRAAANGRSGKSAFQNALRFMFSPPLTSLRAARLAELTGGRRNPFLDGRKCTSLAIGARLETKRDVDCFVEVARPKADHAKLKIDTSE